MRMVLVEFKQDDVGQLNFNEDDVSQRNFHDDYDGQFQRGSSRSAEFQ